MLTCAKFIVSMLLVGSIVELNKIVLKNRNINNDKCLNREYIVELIKSRRIKNYRIFYNVDEIDTWADNLYTKWYDNISKKCENLMYNGFGINPLRGLEFYGGNMYSTINSRLRSERNTYDEYLDEVIKNIDEAFFDVPEIDENIICFRKVDVEFFEKLASKSIVDIRKGDSINDKGFMSTSLMVKGTRHSYEIDENLSFVFLIIKVPKGSKCIFMGQISPVPCEWELLIDRNKTLVVDDILLRNEKQIILLCKLV